MARRGVAGMILGLFGLAEEVASHSSSCPSLHLTAPAESLTSAMKADARKEARHELWTTRDCGRSRSGRMKAGASGRGLKEH